MAPRNALLDLFRQAQSAPPYVPPSVMERMHQEPRPWDTVERAPDGRKWGLNVPHEGAGRNYAYPLSDENRPDASPYFMNMPNMGMPGTSDPERAYHPTLTDQNRMISPQDAQEQQMWRQQGLYPEQIEAAKQFQTPKTNQQIFGQEPFTAEFMMQLLPYLQGP